MMRIAWITDPHFNFVTPDRVRQFWDDGAELAPDAVLIGGDIGEAHDMMGYLMIAAEQVEVPVYFVLGNHDYYYGSIARVRQAVTELARRSPRLHYLPAAGIVSLTPEVALIGHGGWADGRAGDYHASGLLLNDFFLIDELVGLNATDRLDRLILLGEEAAAYLRTTLSTALETHRRAVVLTHVPPFEAACRHNGQPTSDDYLPHYASRAVGQALLAVMAERPDRTVTVLCGHTHSEARVQIAPNLHAIAGSVEYGEPRVQQIFEIEESG
jgi:Icc-related predicted phosphoesterase